MSLPVDFCDARLLPRVSTEEVDAEEAVDDATENWPVAADLRGDLDNIKCDVCALPLCVHADNQFVEVQETI